MGCASSKVPEYIICDLKESIQRIEGITGHDSQASEEIHRMYRLVAELQDNAILHNVEFTMDSAIKEAVRRTADLNDLVKIRLNLDPLAARNVYISDKDRIVRVLEQLLANSLLYTIDGSVDISTESTDDSSIITIQDSGPGGVSMDKSGYGLGVVETNLKVLNGEIHIDSPEGQGTCVTISLPIKPLSTRRNASVCHEGTIRRASSRARLYGILVIASDTHNRETFVDTIRSMGYTKVYSVSMVEEAKRIEAPFHVIFADRDAHRYIEELQELQDDHIEVHGMLSRADDIATMIERYQ